MLITRLLASAALVLLAVGCVSLVLVRDGRVVRDALTVARQDVLVARDALAQGDIERAEVHLSRSRTALLDASARTNRIIWQWAAEIPLLGNTPETVGEIVDAVDLATRVGSTAVERAAPLVAQDERRIEAIGGAIPLEKLRRVSGELDQLDLAALERAHDRLRRSPATWVPAEVVDARREVLDTVGSTVASVQNLQRALDVIPAILGAEGRREYFLAMQNPAELRGTGGFIGYFATLTAEGGRLELSEPQVYAVLNEDSDTEATAPNSHAPPDFERRYGQAAASTFLANANLDPDLPTTAPVVLDLYREVTGRQLDGLIAIDPIALGMVMAPIGPIEVPARFADPSGRIPNPLPPEGVAAVTMVNAYDVFGGSSQARKDYLRELATAAFDQVFSSSWDGVAVARALADAASGGHLQIYSEDEEERAALESVGIGGSLAAPDGHDLLAVTANNTAGNKMDAFAAHELTGRISLVGDAPASMRRLVDLRLGMFNPVPTEGFDRYIVGSWEVTGGQDEPFGGQPGLNRTWFSVWGPPDSILLTAEAGRDVTVAPGHVIHGHRAVDVQIETPSKQERHATVRLSSSATTIYDGGDLVYKLFLHRQPKVIPDRVDLQIVAPEGWHVADVSATGGGNGGGMGPNGGPGPTVTSEEVDATTVRLAGDINRPVVLTVRYDREPSWAARALDWLGIR